MPMLTTLRMGLAGMALPLRRANALARGGHLVGHARGRRVTNVSPLRTNALGFGRAQGDVAGPARFPEVDLVAAEHGFDAVAQAGLCPASATSTCSVSAALTQAFLGVNRRKMPSASAVKRGCRAPGVPLGRTRVAQQCLRQFDLEVASVQVRFHLAVAPRLERQLRVESFQGPWGQFSLTRRILLETCRSPILQALSRHGAIRLREYNSTSLSSFERFPQRLKSVVARVFD